MKIAILGTRGIPNHYGGFEQYAELLSVYLAKIGWDVTVYSSSRHSFQKNQYHGVKIKHIYEPPYLGNSMAQICYDFGCILDCRHQHFDLVYQLGYTSSAVFNFLFPSRSLIVTNMDGLEWKRSKYNRPARMFLKFSERLVVKYSHHLIADSIGIQKYLAGKFKKAAFYSAYTTSMPEAFDEKVLQELGLEKGKYDLVIARIEPENNIETIILGHSHSNSSKTLIIIGACTNAYSLQLVKKYQSAQVVFLGGIYEKNKLNSLRYYAHVYFHGHSVGGTNPSLLEAMACSCSIVAHNNRFNKEVLQSDALYFNEVGEITSYLDQFESLNNPYLLKKNKYRDRIQNFYCEEVVFAQLKNKMIEWLAQFTKKG